MQIYFMSCQIIIIEIYTYASMQRSAVSDLFTISRQLESAIKAHAGHGKLTTYLKHDFNR